jgi:hypothetical protein
VRRASDRSTSIASYGATIPFSVSGRQGVSTSEKWHGIPRERVISILTLDIISAAWLGSAALGDQATRQLAQSLVVTQTDSRDL